MIAIGLIVAICGCLVSMIGNYLLRRQSLRRAEQSSLTFDMSQRITWKRRLDPSETRKLYFIQATSTALLFLGFAIATGVFTR